MGKLDLSHPVGRDSKIGNDVFFACSFIDYIARRTKNRRVYIVNQLGEKRISKLVDLADVYHSDNIDKVADDFIKEADIQDGTFDNVAKCKYSVPTHWDIGKVYKRLVLMIAEREEVSPSAAITRAYNSFISEKIDDYNCSLYYENPETIFQIYQTGVMM